MDIQHTVNALAALTLSKDMTFRDYAQGAYRMRGVGKGQRIEVLIIPEVRKLVYVQLAAAKLASRCAILREEYEDGSTGMMPLAVVAKPNTESADAGVDASFTASSSSLVAASSSSDGAATAAELASSQPSASDLSQVLQDVSSWLLLQTCLSEAVQHHMLCEQDLANVWRKVCFRTLLESYTEVGSVRCTEAVHSCLEVWRERLDYSLDDRVSTFTAFSQKLRLMVKRNHAHLQNEADQATVRHVLNLLTQSQGKVRPGEASPSPPPPSVALDLLDTAATDAPLQNLLNSEQQQENEQEQEQEQEQVRTSN